MDVLKAQFARMQEQLAGLTATQRMLAGSLVAIMVLTMLLWARYASNAEMVPVLDQPFDTDQIAQATMKLNAQGIECKVVGDRVEVPADKHDQALTILSYDQVLPSSTKSGFDEIIKQTNLFDPKDKTDLMFNQARAAELAQIISGFPGVAKAKVVINPVRDRYVGNELKPSGVVTIQTRGDANIKQLVESAAATVASATADLVRSRVTVIIGDRTYKARDESSGFSGDDLYEQTQQQEQYYEDKIAKDLANYNSPLITVSVELETSSSQEVVTKYDPALQKETQINTRTDDSAQTPPPSAEPGVLSNTGASVVPGSGGGGTTTSTEENRTTFENKFGSTVQQVNKPAGHQTVVSAAVALPRSHFIEIYKGPNQDGKDPDEGALQKWAEPELARVKKSVQAACGLKSDSNVFVDLYTDSPAMPVLYDSTATSTGAAVTSHIKEIAIGVLALLSLFMVSMMVRKSAPAPAIALQQEEIREAPSFLDGDEEIAGIVGGGQNTMDGMELDDESVKGQQMVEQVTTMVQENPDAAATLVKRWMNRA